MSSLAETKTGSSSDAPITHGKFSALGYNGGDLALSMQDTSELANTINASLIYSISLMVQRIATLRENIQEAQKAATQPIIDQINALKAQSNLSSSDGLKLQGLTTQYNDILTTFQQQQTTAGGYQDAETQSLSSVSSSVENFINFLSKLVSILQQTAR